VGSHAAAIESLLEGYTAKKSGGALLHGLGAKLHRASDLSTHARRPSSPLASCIGLERLLAGGLPRGKLLELAGRRSSGRFSIGLAALASVTSTGEPAALVDLDGHLDPQAAAAAGVDLELLLWARPRRVKEALAAAEMLLAAGFPLVVADLGLSPRGARYVPDAAWLRLARAAQSRESSLLLLTPWRMSGIAADAVVSAGASRPHWSGSGKSSRLLTGFTSHLTLEKLARQTPATTVTLSLSLLPLPPGEGRGEGVSGAKARDSELGPRDSRESSFCHPEEQRDEGSAPTQSLEDQSRSFASLRTTERPITNHQSPIPNPLVPSLPPTTYHLPPSF
jgi:hypothetical protein